MTAPAALDPVTMSITAIFSGGVFRLHDLPINSGISAMVRVGRQELVYGAQKRLVSPSDWSNVRRSFDGAKVSVSFPNDTLELFVARPVTIVANRVDGDDDHTTFSGIYNVTALPEAFSLCRHEAGS